MVFRRTDLGLSIANIKNNLDEYAEIMARELGWSEFRIKEEKNEIRSKFTVPYSI